MPGETYTPESVRKSAEKTEPSHSSGTQQSGGITRRKFLGILGVGIAGTFLNRVAGNPVGEVMGNAGKTVSDGFDKAGDAALSGVRDSAKNIADTASTIASNTEEIRQRMNRKDRSPINPDIPPSEYLIDTAIVSPQEVRLRNDVTTSNRENIVNKIIGNKINLNKSFYAVEVYGYPVSQEKFVVGNEKYDPWLQFYERFTDKNGKEEYKPITYKDESGKENYVYVHYSLAKRADK